MAAPMVSATAALMLQQTPALTTDQVKARLMATAFKGLVQASTATDLTTRQSFQEQADIFTIGAVYLDIQGALQNTNLAPATVGSALSPFASSVPFEVEACRSGRTLTTSRVEIRRMARSR